MTRFSCTTAELHTPVFLSLMAKAAHRENQRIEKLSAARRALSIANKLKNSNAKKYHQGRIFRALNSLRAAT